MLITGVLLFSLGIPAWGQIPEKECTRWLKLVDGEVRERKEALRKKSGPERERIQELVTKTSAQIAEARKVCVSGNDKGATLIVLDLWDAFVEDERREGVLSLNSRLNVLSLRIDRLKAFLQKGWKTRMSKDEERRFLAEIDKFDGVLAETLKQALR